MGWEARQCAEDEQGDTFAAQDLVWCVGPPWEEDTAASVDMGVAARELRPSAVDADGTLEGVGAGAVGWDVAGEPGGKKQIIRKSLDGTLEGYGGENALLLVLPAPVLTVSCNCRLLTSAAIVCWAAVSWAMDTAITQWAAASSRSSPVVAGRTRATSPASEVWASLEVGARASRWSLS